MIVDDIDRRFLVLELKNDFIEAFENTTCKYEDQSDLVVELFLSHLTSYKKNKDDTFEIKFDNPSIFQIKNPENLGIIAAIAKLAQITIQNTVVGKYYPEKRMIEFDQGCISIGRGPVSTSLKNIQLNVQRESFDLGFHSFILKMLGYDMDIELDDCKELCNYYIRACQLPS